MSKIDPASPFADSNDISMIARRPWATPKVIAEHLGEKVAKPFTATESEAGSFTVNNASVPFGPS